MKTITLDEGYVRELKGIAEEFPEIKLMAVIGSVAVRGYRQAGRGAQQTMPRVRGVSSPLNKRMLASPNPSQIDVAVIKRRMDFLRSEKSKPLEAVEV